MKFMDKALEATTKQPSRSTRTRPHAAHARAGWARWSAMPLAVARRARARAPARATDAEATYSTTVAEWLDLARATVEMPLFTGEAHFRGLGGRRTSLLVVLVLEIVTDASPGAGLRD